MDLTPNKIHSFFSFQIHLLIYPLRTATLVLEKMPSLSRAVGMSMALLTPNPPQMFTSDESIYKHLLAPPLHLAVRCLVASPMYVQNDFISVILSPASSSRLPEEEVVLWKMLQYQMLKWKTFTWRLESLVNVVTIQMIILTPVLIQISAASPWGMWSAQISPLQETSGEFPRIPSPPSACRTFPCAWLLSCLLRGSVQMCWDSLIQCSQNHVPISSTLTQILRPSVFPSYLQAVVQKPSEMFCVSSFVQCIGATQRWNAFRVHFT